MKFRTFYYDRIPRGFHDSIFIISHYNWIFNCDENCTLICYIVLIFLLWLVEVSHRSILRNLNWKKFFSLSKDTQLFSYFSLVFVTYAKYFHVADARKYISLFWCGNNEVSDFFHRKIKRDEGRHVGQEKNRMS